MFDLFTFGEALAVFISTDTDSVLTAKKFERVTAGAEANVAVAISRLGLKARFFTKVGDDQIGKSILADIAAEKVEVADCSIGNSFSGSMVRNPGTQNKVEVNYLRKGSAASLINESDISQEFIENAKWLHTTGITCAISESAAGAVSHAQKIARTKKIPQSFDLNLRRKIWSEAQAAKTLFPLAQNVDLLIGGEDEYQVVFNESDPEKALQLANKRGCKIAVMTKGDQPMRYAIDGKISQLNPPKVKSVDPVGSGDAFTGGTIAALLSGKSALEALTQGSYCGARVASMFGDWTGIPSGKNGIIDEKIKNEMSK